MSYHGPTIYEHYCNNCTYLGSLIMKQGSINIQDQWNDSREKVYDLYICLNKKTRILTSLIVRNSSQDSDYSSIALDIFDSNQQTFSQSIFSTVYERARNDGLI